MAFKMTGWSAGDGTGSHSPNKKNGSTKATRAARAAATKKDTDPFNKTTDRTEYALKGKSSPYESDEKTAEQRQAELDEIAELKKMKDLKKKSGTTRKATQAYEESLRSGRGIPMTTSPNKATRAEALAKVKEQSKAKYAEIVAADGQEAGQAYLDSQLAKLKEGKDDFLKHETGAKGPGTYVKPGGSVKTSMKDLPMGSAERKAEYDRRGWAYDDTIKGGPAKEEPSPDPTTETKPAPDKGKLTDPEYKVSSQKGRKTTTVVRKDGKVITDEHTDRNIGDKRVRTFTGGEKGDIRHKEKFDAEGKKTKDKRKITLPDGTVIKQKTTKRGKKVKVRKKGQWFGKKLNKVADPEK